ncbi:flagellin FliC, partial [Escherichia coli]|nr:flagellin FliC [Escherichia coli]
TYNASTNDFTTENTVATGTATTDLGATLKAAAGQSQSGTYTFANGKVNFDVDASGNITIGGEKAFLVGGALTTNDPTGSTPATMSSLFKAADDK